VVAGVVAVVLIGASIPFTTTRISTAWAQERIASRAVTRLDQLSQAVAAIGGHRAVFPCHSSFVAVNHSVQTALAWKLHVTLAQVAQLLDRHGPDAVAVEELYFGTNARTAFAVGQARGVILLAAGQRGLPARSYTPQQVKGAVCGHGRAGKQQVARMVTRLLGMTAPPAADHSADALAVAICDLN